MSNTYPVYMAKQFYRKGEKPQTFVRREILPMPPHKGLVLVYEQAQEGHAIDEVCINRDGAIVCFMPTDGPWDVHKENGDCTEDEWESVKECQLRGWEPCADWTSLKQFFNLNEE